MSVRMVVLVSSLSAAIAGMVLWAAQQQGDPQPTKPAATVSDPATLHREESSEPGRRSASAASSTEMGSRLHAVSSPSEAATTFELVQTNLRCQVDRDASTSGEHIRSTTDDLCKDLLSDPMSREEIFKAITFAAENGSVPAQLDYSLYASRIFEDERNALNPELVTEYKNNTIRFLKAAGAAGESQAYVRLSDAYKNGILIERDPIMAYAYAEAYFRTGSSRYGSSLLKGAMNGLDSSQQRRGKEIATQILNGRSGVE